MYYDRTKIDSEEEQALQDLSVPWCDNMLLDAAFPWGDARRRLMVQNIIGTDSSDDDDCGPSDGEESRTQRALRESDYLYCRT